MSLPKTYKAAVVDKAGGEFTMQDRDMPTPKEGEVLVKVSHCGVCHSDHSIVSGHMGPMVSFPCVTGHEAIGKIVAVGKGAEKQWKEGDTVGLPWFGGADLTCKACKRGLFQMCEKGDVNGATKAGGYAGYVISRAEATVRIPDGIDLAEAAPLLCAGVTVFNGIRQQKLLAGDIVAVQGLGGLGHLGIQYASKMGYRTVAISSNDKKKDFAHKLGAHDYIDTSKEDAAEALQKMGGASLIVVTAPNPEIISPLVNGLGILGKLLILAPVGDVPVNSVAMIMKGTSVGGWPSGHALDCEEAISFANTHGVKCMVEKFPFSEVKKATEKMLSGEVRFRSVLVMDQ